MNNFSKIGIGALHFGSFTSKAEAVKLIDQSYNLGINWIDTSPIYGNAQSEHIISSSSNYKHMKIATKFGLEVLENSSTFGVRIAEMDKLYIQSSLENSLKNLKIDSIDLYQLHAFDNTRPVTEVLFELQKFVKEGKIKNVGVLNLCPDELKKVIDFKNSENFNELNSIQVQYNMIERKLEKDIIKVSRDNKFQVIANRVLASGILTGKYKSTEYFPSDSRASKSARVKNKINENVIDVLNKIHMLNSDNLNITQISILWALQSGFIDTLVLGIRNQKQLEEVARLLSNDYSYIFDTVNNIIEEFYSYDIYNSPSKYME